MHQMDARRMVAMMRQIGFLVLRDEAASQVIRGATWLERVKWLFKPKSFIKAIDDRHIELMKKADEATAAAAEKRKEESLKPKIEIVSPGIIVNGKR